MDQTAALQHEKEEKARAGESARARLEAGRDPRSAALRPRTLRAILVFAAVVFLIAVFFWNLSAASGRLEPWRIAFLVLSVILPVSLALPLRPKG